MVYGMFSHSLEKTDHELIESKAREYSALYQKDGINGLKKMVTDIRTREESSHFLVRLVNEEGASLFYHAPVNHERFDVAEVEKTLEKKPHGGQWQFILADIDDDKLEILTVATGDGTFLQVGKSADGREDLLESLRDIFLIALVTTIGIAGVSGILLSNGVLAPVRALVSTIQRIQKGNLTARVTTAHSGDELEMLSSLFNAMLDKIQALLQAMKETQDNVAHDLRTPMTRFRSIAEIALRKDQTPEFYKEALSEGLECSEEILTLINTLMEITEADAGAIRLALKSVPVNEVIVEVLDLYEMTAEDKRIAIKVSCLEPLIVKADRGYLKRVLSNLLDNAIKYTDEGGSIEISARQSDKMVVISFRDTGVGVDKKDLERIWNRLYRGDKSRSRAGLGLGLSVVQAVVKAHGGSVAVESELGQGSIFSVSLPSASSRSAV